MKILEYCDFMERGKRLLTLSVKINQAEMDAISKIAEREDRPLGYVGRELMLRGMRLYIGDGKLKTQTNDLLPLETSEAEDGGKLAA